MKLLLPVALSLLLAVPAFAQDDTERRLSGVQKQVTILHAKNEALEKRTSSLEKKLSALIRIVKMHQENHHKEAK